MIAAAHCIDVKGHHTNWQPVDGSEPHMDADYSFLDMAEEGIRTGCRDRAMDEEQSSRSSRDRFEQAGACWNCNTDWDGKEHYYWVEQAWACCGRNTGCIVEGEQHYSHTWEESTHRSTTFDGSLPRKVQARGASNPYRKSLALLQCLVPFYRGGAELVSSFE